MLHRAYLRSPGIGVGFGRKKGSSGGVAPINPLTLGPVFLHNAKVASSVCSDLAGTVPAGIGGQVQFWGDLSGNGNHSTMSVASLRPLRQADELTFDGTGDRMGRATLTGGSNPQPYTVLCVGRAAANNGCFFSVGAPAQFQRSGQTFSTLAISGANLAAGACRDASVRRSWLIEFNGNSGRIECGTRVMLQGAIGTAAFDRINVGSTHGGATFLNGALTLVAGFPRLLTTQEKLGVDAWVRAECGTPNELVNDTYSPVLIPTGKVMPLGDSITVGSGGTGSASELGAWRDDLFALALANGKTVTFVGAYLNGPTTVSGQTFPRAHGGVGGQNCSVIAARIAEVGTAAPEAVIVHAGTNDCNAESIGGAAIDPMLRLGNLLDGIRAQAPTAQVWCTDIIPSSDPVLNAIYTRWNAQVAEVVQLRANSGMKVVYLPMSAYFSAQGGATPDTVHPNDAGYAIMAQRYYDAVSPYLP